LAAAVCNAIWDELQEECIQLPQTQNQWIQKSEDFLSRWQYPFGLAAIDGKHVEVQAFQKSGKIQSKNLITYLITPYRLFC
jgi:hypothetical protein